MTAPSWLSLLAPLPQDAVVERKPVASAQQIADGSAAAIAGWESLSVNLSDPHAGSRHVLVTLDASGSLLSGGDYVVLVTPPMEPGAPAIYHHESIGGRLNDDGSFQGTRWRTRTEQMPDADEAISTSSTPSPPSDEEIAALRRLLTDVLSRPL